ncbi:hypothetical protein [Paraburkholderia strydomiana]|jgi:DNA-binding transcriptional LysR family regulator
MRELNRQRLRHFHGVLANRTIRGAAIASIPRHLRLPLQTKPLEDELGTALFERRPQGAYKDSLALQATICRN